MNYHLFIVDERSLKYHLEFGFVGTGRVNNDFNISLYKDLCRLKNNDKIIFYVQKLRKFYGIFKVINSPFFESNENAYLQPNPLNIVNNSGDNITLRYRCKIEPYEVYRYGIDEFDLIDILPNNVVDVLWSLLYRKLKAERGNSPLFGKEFNIIRNKLKDINNNQIQNSNGYTFINAEIIPSMPNNYGGNDSDNINLTQFFLENNYFEDHIHSLLLKETPSIIFSEQFDWLGNEVYCGAGMQAMDILFIKNNVFNIIEIKKGNIPLTITEQILKYIRWLKNRFNDIAIEHYQPIILGEKIKRNKSNRSIMNTRRNKLIEFNNLNISLPIKYYEYEIIDSDILIHFIDYSYNEENIFLNASSYSIVNNSYV